MVRYACFHVEEECNEAQKNLIKDVLIETNILNAISKMYNLNTSFE